MEPTNGKIVLQRQTTYADASWARTWCEIHHFRLPWQQVEVKHCLESLPSSRPHWLSHFT